MKNKEVLLQKLNILSNEVKQSMSKVDNSTREYLVRLEKLIENYIQKLKSGRLNPSNGGNLGFRRAIIEYDDLSVIESLYKAAKDVDDFYSCECNQW